LKLVRLPAVLIGALSLFGLSCRDAPPSGDRIVLSPNDIDFGVFPIGGRGEKRVELEVSVREAAELAVRFTGDRSAFSLAGLPARVDPGDGPLELSLSFSPRFDREVSSTMVVTLTRADTVVGSAQARLRGHGALPSASADSGASTHNDSGASSLDASSGNDATVDGGGQPDVGHADTADRWRPMSTDGAPASNRHVAVWTGTEMIVWGGLHNVGTSTEPRYEAHDEGAVYNRERDRWRSMSITNAPAARQHHSAIWTGTEMFVWGGSEASRDQDQPVTGGLYNPVTNSWRSVAVNPVFTAPGSWTQIRVVPAWTGTEVVVAVGVVTGRAFEREPPLEMAFYNPATDSWRHADTSSTAIPWLDREEGQIVSFGAWTGSELFGVTRQRGGIVAPGRRESVIRFVPGTGWSPVPGYPGGSLGCCPLWTGFELVVWSGNWTWTNSAFARGAVYVPETGDWRSMPPLAPGGSGVTVDPITIGRKVLVDNVRERSVVQFLIYDPVSDTFSRSTTVDAPSYRFSPTVVWTGRDVIMWGGQDEHQNPLAHGAIYTPPQ